MIDLACSVMKELLILVAHLMTTIAKLLSFGGAKAVIADSLLMKWKLLIMDRIRRYTPNQQPAAESTYTYLACRQ